MKIYALQAEHNSQKNIALRLLRLSADLSMDTLWAFSASYATNHGRTKIL